MRQSYSVRSNTTRIHGVRIHTYEVYGLVESEVTKQHKSDWQSRIVRGADGKPTVEVFPDPRPHPWWRTHQHHQGDS